LPKRSDFYKTVREHFARGENQEIIGLVERAETPLPAGVAYYIAAAHINLNDYASAREYIEAALDTADEADKANLIALDGLIEARRGDDDRYLQKAKEAVEECATATTLYHLGIAMGNIDNQAGTPLLQASLIAAEVENDLYAEARNAYALAINHWYVGAYKDALSWMRFSHIRTVQPGLKLQSFNYVAFIQIFVNDTANLEGELREMVSLAEASAPAYAKMELSSTLADLYQATGRYGEALTIYETGLRDAPRALWGLLSHGCVRALCALERPHDARNAAETAVAVTASFSTEHQMRSRLALGIALWPSELAVTLLSDAYRHFSQTRAYLATEAALHLAASARAGHSVPAGVVEVVSTAKQTFTVTGLRLLAGRAFDTLFPAEADLPDVQLQVLGEVRALRQGVLIKLRQRSLELLVLLLHRPSGYRAEELSEALYGDAQLAALRVEIHRLRKIGLTIQTQPYRLETPVQADSIALETALSGGHLRDAVALYRGPLLPMSNAPGIVELRNGLEAALEATVLAATDTKALWELAQWMPFNLELWEALELRLPLDDPRASVVAGRSARVRTELGV